MDGSRPHACALVTGASAGLGAEFARQLAPSCRRMILVARREDRLRELEDVLRHAHPDLAVHGVALDLTDPGDLDRLIGTLAGGEWQPTLLVNNAGMGDYGDFVSADWEKLDRVIALNVSTAKCCSPPMLMGPPSVAAALQPPTHKSLVGHTMPHERPTGLSERICFAAP